MQKPPRFSPGRLFSRLRACAEQFAHAPSRRRAVCAGRLVTRDAACSAAAARKAVHPVISLPARLRRASRAPCLFLLRVSHARAPAVSKTRTGFASLPSHARTRFFLGASPRMAPVFLGGEKSYLLFPAAGRKPAGRKPAPNFHEYAKRGAKRTPTHRNARKAELCSFGFSAFPLSAGGLRPKGRVSRPAARKKERTAAGRRRPPSHRNA